jgi:tRNA(Ile)-lysidine synthase
MGNPDLITVFRRTVRRHGMVRAGDRVLAAVSGGADSVALLHLLSRHREAWKFELACVHVDHGLRGVDSDADAAFTEELTASRGAAFHLVRKTPDEWRTRGRSLEADARELRYAAFREIAAANGYTRIATGHTASDQAETVLLHVLKGAGLDGLAAIPPVRDGVFIRPLLDVSRDQVRVFLRREGIAWREDATNALRDADRNRVRLDLLPLLARSFNPRIEEALARLADHARDDADTLRALAREFLHLHAREGEDGVVLPLAALESLPPGLRHRVYREAFLAARGSVRALTREHVLAIDRLADGAAGAEVALPGDWIARRAGGTIGIAARGESRRRRR